MIKGRYFDIINKQQHKVENKKSGNEIVADIVTRAGLELS